MFQERLVAIGNMTDLTKLEKLAFELVRRQGLSNLLAESLERLRGDGDGNVLSLIARTEMRLNEVAPEGFFFGLHPSADGIINNELGWWSKSQEEVV